MLSSGNPILDTDSEDEVPAGWEERVTLDGKVYYANHESQKTQWEHPSTKKRKFIAGELPYGWEQKVAEDGHVFYVDHINDRTTFTDPRLAFAEAVKQSPSDIRQKFDGSSTALQVLQGRDLTGQYVLITGANCGIGFETARALAMHGATVTIACRDQQAGEDAKVKILKQQPQALVEVSSLDLASFTSVKCFADEYKKKLWPINMLVLNAGVFALPHTLTEDGYETTIQVNHLSHMYLTLLLKEVLIQSAPARVVSVASASHWYCDMNKDTVTEDTLSPSSTNYRAMLAYNLSKLCNVLFSAELNRRLSGCGVVANSVHPGNMISSHLPRNWWVYRFLFAVVRPFTKSTEQGAASLVYCAVSPQIAGMGGLYINNCCRCHASKAGSDEILQRKVWEVSHAMILSKTVQPTDVMLTQ